MLALKESIASWKMITFRIEQRQSGASWPRRAPDEAERFIAAHGEAIRDKEKLAPAAPDTAKLDPTTRRVAKADRRTKSNERK
ncbi:hypothetical protein [Arthrobacter sp. PsM3]|uniref:hypothetical protein n=1 Tax=Arthrobacter sp. PsM3 TaxID=3030531 RepID=UPI00263B728A|nr:hypothetical protein [Arthrobacter sp. PsM3]MDN4646173.1 hypothetical protein [Arthrobacter sp. PsM3]